MIIKKPTLNDMTAIVRTMAASFQNDPLYSYFVENHERRKHFLKDFMRFRLTFGMQEGLAFRLGKCKGIALWFPSSRQMDALKFAAYGGTATLLKCTPDERERIVKYVDYVDLTISRFVSTEYWHISPLCIAPEKQGMGLGSQLLQHGVTLLSKPTKPCLVVTQTLINKAFYEKNGFVTVNQSFVPGTQIHTILLIHNNGNININPESPT